MFDTGIFFCNRINQKSVSVIIEKEEVEPTIYIFPKVNEHREGGTNFELTPG